MAMTIKYIGCENAKSAIAKVVSTDTKTITYYGSSYDAEQAIFDKHNDTGISDEYYRKGKKNNWVYIEYWW